MATLTKAGKDIGKHEHFSIAGRHAKQSLWKTVCQFLIKVNILFSCDPAIPRIGVNSKELKVGTQILVQHCS